MRAKMWLTAVALVLVLLGTLAAQTAPAAQGGAAPPPPQKQEMQPGMMHGQGGMHEMHMMHMQHMQQMKQMQKELEQMRGLVKQLRATSAGMNAKDKAAVELNAQLWDAMLNHMDNNMKQMHEMSGGMMHEHMMQGEGGHEHSDAGGEHHRHEAPPEAPAPPAPTK